MSRKNEGLNRRFYNAPESPVPHYLHVGPDACSFIMISQPAGIPARNLVRNPSLERSTDGWGLSVLGSTLTRTTEESYVGANSLRVTAPAGTAAYATFYGPLSSVPVVYPTVAMTNQATLYGKIYVKANIGDRIRVRLIPDGVFAVIPPYHSTTDSQDASGDWQLFQVEGMADSAVPVPAMLYIEVDNGSGQNVFYVDGALMSSSNVLPFDGDSIGSAWDGQPHNAESNIADYASMGPPVNLTDLGLDIIAYEGFGVPPVDNLSTSFADRHGAHFQRQKYLPRTLTIQADVQTCDSWTDVAKRRCEFVRALFNYRFREICRFDLIVYWTLRDNCCRAISRTLQMPVVYEGGLEGSMTFLWGDRITVQLSAYEDPLWQSPNVSASEDFSGTATGAIGAITPSVVGTEAVKPIFYVTAGAADIVLPAIVNDVGGVRLNFVENGIGAITIPAGNTLVVDTHPLSFDIYLVDPAGVRTDRRFTFDYAASTFGDFHLFPGANNLRVDVFGPIAPVFPDGSEIIAVWREKYIDSSCAEVLRC